MGQLLHGRSRSGEQTGEGAQEKNGGKRRQNTDKQLLLQETGGEDRSGEDRDQHQGKDADLQREGGGDTEHRAEDRHNDQNGIADQTGQMAGEVHLAASPLISAESRISRRPRFP